MNLASDIVLKSLGIWLFILAYAKGWQLLSEPIIDYYIWTHRPFELVLAIWLFSGKSKKYAWLATLLCYCLFSVVPLYKGITSVEFCSCFGSVYTSSWKTFLAFYLPAITALLVFRPKGEKSFAWPSIPPFKITVLSSLVVLSLNGPVFVSNAIILSYMAKLETWVIKKVAIKCTDTVKLLKEVTWTVLSHHHNYLSCDQNCQLLKRINQNIHVSSAIEKRMTEYEINK